MRKFNSVYKEKKQRTEQLVEQKRLGEFKQVYDALLEKYNINEFHELDDEYQDRFLVEINKYWTEDDGVTENGQKFLRRKSDFINESSTTLQRKNYLKKKARAIIAESIDRTGLKWRLYDVLDEMYKSTGSANIAEVMSPEMISDTLENSFKSAVNEMMEQVRTELNESAKNKK